MKKYFYMRVTAIVSLFLLVLSLNVVNKALAQCAVGGTAACSGGNGTLPDFVTIHPGDYYWFSATGTRNNVSLNGGIIVVCGNLTLNGFNFNSGGIVINPGASLTINGSLPIGGMGSYIHNHGTLVVNGDMYLNGNPTVVACMSGAGITVTGAIHVNSTSMLAITNANVVANSLVLQSSSSPNMCMCGGSVSVVNLGNNNYNSVSAPCGPACISFSGNAIINTDLTASSNLNVCQATGATAFPANWGSANVVTDCPACSILPVQTVKINVEKVDNYNEVVISWNITNMDFHQVTLQRSTNENPNLWTDLTKSYFPKTRDYYTDHEFDFGINKMLFYRLKITNKDGIQVYSAIQQVLLSIGENVHIYYTPHNSSLFFDNVNLAENWYLDIFDLQGKCVQHQLLQSVSLPVSQNNGIYLARIYNGKSQASCKFVVNQ